MLKKNHDLCILIDYSNTPFRINKRKIYTAIPSFSPATQLEWQFK